MVYKKYYYGQRSGKTIRKQHMRLQSNDGYVEYRLLQDRLNDPTADRVQKLQDKKDELFPDGRVIPAVQDEDNYPEFKDLPLNFPHRQGDNVLYSLDKYKRWSLAAQLQNSLEPLSEEDFRVVLYERKTLTRGRMRHSTYMYYPLDISTANCNDCVKYLDSKTSPSCARPRGSAASFFCDLREKCLKGDNSGRKVMSRRRGRHNRHNRGIQRKSELHRQDVPSEEHHLKYYYLYGEDNKDMVEFRYEICAPGKKTTRSKWFEEFSCKRLADRVSHCRKHAPITEKKALSKHKGVVNSKRGAWQKWQLKMEIDEMQDNSARSVNLHSNDGQMNRDVEKEEEMNEERTALTVDIMDCLQKARQTQKTAKRTGKKRKALAEDLHVGLEKKSHIVYLNETSKADEDEEVNGSDSSVAVLVNQVIEEEVPLPSCAKCSLKKSNVEDFLQRTPGSHSRSVYPVVHHLPLLASVNKDENENFESLEGNIPLLEVQQTFSSAMNSDNQDIVEYRLRILGDQRLHPNDVMTEELDQLITAQEKVFLILSAETIFQLAKNVVQQYNPKEKTKGKHHDDLCELKPAFHWLPGVSYSVATIQQASLKCVPLTSTDEKVENKPLSSDKLADIDVDCVLDCGVCFTSLGDSGKDCTEGVVVLPCQHSFCRTCMLHYAVEKIKTGTLFISCMEYRCSSELDQITIQSFVPDLLFVQWLRRKQERAVMSTGKWKWCPNTKCDHVLSIAENDPNFSSNGVPKIFSKSPLSLRGVTCFCSTEFCMECNEFPHWPATCQQIKSYVKALDIQNDLMKEEDHARIFRVKVKPCPLCKEKVDKNGGCNAMSCRCGHHFCWLCLKPNPYSRHACNEVALQEIDVVNTKVVKFEIHYLELAYSYRKRCFKLVKQKETLVTEERKFKTHVEIGCLDPSEAKQRLALKTSQLRHLNTVIQSLKLLENVCISISNIPKKWPAGKEFKSLSRTVDFILSRLLELLQIPPNTETDQQMNRLQCFLTEKVKMMVLLAFYLKQLYSKRVKVQRELTVRYKIGYD